MMLVTRAELPVRPLYSRGESVAGYLFRIYSGNGHSLPAEVFTLIDVLYRARQNRFLVDAFTELQRIIGPEHELSATRWLHRYSGNAKIPAWEKWSLLLDSNFKCCPMCLAQYGYHLEIWERKFVTVCPAHQCRLVRNCPQCKRPLRWATLESGWRCSCGQQVCEIGPAEVSLQLGQLSSYLCRTWDTELPRDYPMKRVYSPSSLKLAYRTVYHLALLRGLIVAVYRDANGDLNSARQLAAQCLRKSQLSVTRLVTYDGFQSALCRLIRLRWKDTDTVFIRIPQESREMAILRFVASIEDDLPWQKPLSDYLNIFFRQREAALSFSSLVIFNPSITIADRRTQLDVFVKWCKRQFKTPTDAYAVSKENPAVRKYSADNKEAETVDVLGKLIQMAQAGTPCSQPLRSLISNYVLSSDVPTHDATLLRKLAHGLMLLPDGRREQIVDLVDRHKRVKRAKPSSAHGNP